MAILIRLFLFIFVLLPGEDQPASAIKRLLWATRVTPVLSASFPPAGTNWHETPDRERSPRIDGASIPSL
jgi:hypothetical protein